MELEIKSNIIKTANELFMRLGVRSVTMDDVARELSVSKKTLYQYFDNKDNLVLAVVQRHIDFEKEEFTGIPDKSSNAVEEIFHVAHCIREHVSKVNPSTLYDIQKYHMNAFNLFLSFKNEFIKGTVKTNLERGIAEGYYRKELNAEIIAIYRMEQVQMIFDNRVYPSSKFSFSEVQMHLFDHFVHGLLTDEGRKLFKEYQLQEAKTTV